LINITQPSAIEPTRAAVSDHHDVALVLLDENVKASLLNNVEVVAHIALLDDVRAGFDRRLVHLTHHLQLVRIGHASCVGKVKVSKRE
jgi:hypothetical protein